MKKKIIMFISIIIIVLLGILFGIFFLTKEDKIKPDISELGEGIYKEIIPQENINSIMGHTIENGILYYLERKDLSDDECEYYLNTLDYKTGSKNSTKISDGSNSYCYLDKSIISCSNETKISAFDLSLNRVFEEKTSDDYYETIIFYNNVYWQFKEGILKNGKDEIKVPGYDNSFFYVDDIILADNTYLLLQSSNEYYIYDIKNNSLTNTHESKYIKSSIGFCFYTTTYYHVYDLEEGSDTVYEVNGLIAPNTTYFGDIEENKIYQVSDSTNLIEIFNTKNNKVSSFDISSYIKDSLTTVDYQAGAILITTFSEELEFIVVELNNHKLKETNVYDYLINQNKEIEEMVQNIKNKYNVNIKIKDEGEVIFPDFYSQPLYNNGIIKTAIKKVEKILNKFPEHFFEQFMHKEYKGLNIYISGSLTPSDPSTQASNPIAYSLMHDYTYAIVLDSSNIYLEDTVCHELMHTMENNLKNKDKKIFTNWNSLNPSSFKYYNSYTGYHYYEFTPYMTSDNKVYFVSNYSYTFPIEDRAEIFGKMCSEETDEYLKQYPNLYKKAVVIKDELINQYPELANSVFLNNYK